MARDDQYSHRTEGAGFLLTLGDNIEDYWRALYDRFRVFSAVSARRSRGLYVAAVEGLGLMEGFYLAHPSWHSIAIIGERVIDVTYPERNILPYVSIKESPTGHHVGRLHIEPMKAYFSRGTPRRGPPLEEPSVVFWGDRFGVLFTTRARGTGSDPYVAYFVYRTPGAMKIEASYPRNWGADASVVKLREGYPVRPGSYAYEEASPIQKIRGVTRLKRALAGPSVYASSSRRRLR